MKITNPDVIKAGEKELFNAIKDDFDWSALKEVVAKQINMNSLHSKGGEIIIFDNQIAFKIDLELKLDLSLMFDRSGNYIHGESTVPDSTADIESEFSDSDIRKNGAPVGVEENSVFDKENEVDIKPGDDLNMDDESLPDFEEPAEEKSFQPDEDVDFPDLNRQDNMDAGSEEGSESKGDTESHDLNSFDDAELEKELNLSTDYSGDKDETDGLSFADDQSEEDLYSDLDAELDELTGSPDDEEQDIIDLEQVALSEDEKDNELFDDDKDIDDLIKESRPFWGKKK